MSVTINGTNGLTFNDNSTQTTAATGFGFKNRIINGDMRISQRGTSASPTSGGYFTVDRWRFSQASSYAASLTPTISQSSVAPSGFTNSFLYTNGTGAAPTSAQLITFEQYIEGLNCADLEFGSASAATVTVSFWVRASVTGTYAVSLTNSDINRSYVATYTINAANTWEQKSVTIAGDTSGTWLKTNGAGILVRFSIGAGSNLQTTAGTWQAGNYYTTSACTNLTATSGATFYITGVQLEKGSTATSFDYRPYGTELALCQRYFQTVGAGSASNSIPFAIGQAYSTTAAIYAYTLTPNMRATPTLSHSGLNTWNSGGSAAGSPTFAIETGSSERTLRIAASSATGLSAGNATGLHLLNATAFCTFSAEL